MLYITYIGQGFRVALSEGGGAPSKQLAAEGVVSFSGFYIATALSIQQAGNLEKSTTYTCHASYYFITPT